VHNVCQLAESEAREMITENTSLT